MCTQQKIWMRKPLWHPELSRSFKSFVSKRNARWNYSEWSGTRRSNFFILSNICTPADTLQVTPVSSCHFTKKNHPCSICLWRLLWSVYIYIQAGHYVNWEEIQRFWNDAHSFDTTYMRTHASAHINVTGSQLSPIEVFITESICTHTNTTQTSHKHKVAKNLKNFLVFRESQHAGNTGRPSVSLYDDTFFNIQIVCHIFLCEHIVMYASGFLFVTDFVRSRIKLFVFVILIDWCLSVCACVRTQYRRVKQVKQDMQTDIIRLLKHTHIHNTHTHTHTHTQRSNAIHPMSPFARFLIAVSVVRL